MNSMKILITGATGFIGSGLTKRLAELGYNIIAVGRKLEKLDSLSGKIKTLRVDLEDEEAVRQAFRQEKPDIVYHTAALVRSRNLGRLLSVNAEGTRKILQACLDEKVKKVVYVSSVAVIGGNAEVPLMDGLPLSATNPYGVSKLEAEKIALDYRSKGLKIAILRPCMVYGAGEPHGLRLLVNLLKYRLLPVFGSGENRLHLVALENVVDVMVLCLSKDEAYEGTYILADKEALGMKEALVYMAEILGARHPFVISEKMTNLLKKLPLLEKYVSLIIKDRFYSIERLKEKFGYIPRVSVYDGLKRAIETYKK